VDGITRRAFVKGGAVALLGLGATPRFLVRTAAADGERRRPRVLVAIFQRGAVDGLSMVVPHGEPAYYAARDTIAIGRPARGEGDAGIELDGFFALHPAMRPVEPLWRERRLAIVHACGSPDATRSHFDAQDYMETGTPGLRSTSTGWLARGLGALPSPSPSPFRAVSFTPRLPLILKGDGRAIAVQSLAGLDVTAAPAHGAAELRESLESMYGNAAPEVLAGAGRDAFEAIRMLRSAAPDRMAPANGARYPGGRLGNSLKQIAQLIRADVGLEVGFAQSDGWDTHAAQGNAQGDLAARLGELAEGLAAFDRDLGERMADVVVLTMSEFGRTVGENGSRGTDHGHGTAMLVLGGPVRGGRVHGRWPGLDREQLFDRRDLAVTTDFRDLFGEIALRHLGVPASAPLFPGFPIETSRHLAVMSS
jgi:uncharacterized protein (DUF1501 family)